MLTGNKHQQSTVLLLRTSVHLMDLSKTKQRAGWSVLSKQLSMYQSRPVTDNLSRALLMVSQ